ncbi:hypothetical protein KLA_09329 [Cellulophaga geojensis KL-A]|uniref:DUF3325 domain-containing protein n=1 Tax=Cellulophaga geojensis KL-A TaxID=1328323 RepID=A0ABN0RNV4_9FLAO|nr:hypothetical protein [Cellulophaga geojensis]EWH13536.1 hypothetical protein KLA_09329 [Cellulophaga geojensis KL-A]
MTVLILVTTLACLLHYSTSKRAVITKEFKLLFWLHNKQKSVKIAAIVLFLFGLFLAIYTFGLGAGFIIFTILLMLSWSLIVLLAPLKIVNYKLLTLLFLVAFLLEKSL